MSKYIIDIPKTVGMLEAVGSVHYTYFDGIQCQTIIMKSDDIEELNSDYINEHFGDLQDTAYQRGLDEAWKAARRISVIELNGGLAGKELMKIYGTMDIHKIYDDNTASEAIAKLKAYEEKQKAEDEIEVGDEVEWDNDFTGDRFIVTRIYQPYGKKEQCDGIDDDGDVYRAVLIESLVKTGRHFDIASILEEMRHD